MIESRILELLKYVEDNKEVAIFYFPGIINPWELHIENSSSAVRLGEVEGNYIFEGESLEEIICKAEKDLIP